MPAPCRSVYPSPQYYYNPFNQQDYFHSCNTCPAQCAVPTALNNTVAPAVYDQLWTCQLAQLPDLNHTVPFVLDQLAQWLAQVKSAYGFDGLRVDAMAFIDTAPLRKLLEGAGIFSLGEVFLSQDTNGQYQVIETYLEAG